MSLNKYALFAMLTILIVSLSGCICAPLSGTSPTIVPTLTVTPGPSTAPVPPTISPIPSLNTGTQIIWKLPSGDGRLVVKNQVIGQDAVIILAPVSDPKSAVLAVYVKGEHEWTVDGIPDGQYVLYDMIGTNWDDTNKSFLHTSEYAKFDSTLNFYTTATESKVYTVTLSGAAGGVDGLSTAIDPGDVPSLAR